jgi:hypothetical protein
MGGGWGLVGLGSVGLGVVTGGCLGSVGLGESAAKVAKGIAAAQRQSLANDLRRGR